MWVLDPHQPDHDNTPATRRSGTIGPEEAPRRADPAGDCTTNPALGSTAEGTLALALLTLGPDAVIATDADSRIVYFNPIAEELFGYPATEAIGQLIEVLLPPALRSGHVRLRNEYVANPVVRQIGEARIVTGVRKDGCEVAVTIALAPVVSAFGRWVMCVVRDATQLRKAQVRLAQQEKVEAVGRLAGGIAHDINNQLTVIQGYAQILGTDDGLGTIARTHLTEIDKACQRSARMIQQILAYSRKQVLAPCSVDPNALCGGIVDMLRRLVGDKINLVFVPNRELGRILIDPSQLETALVNLVLNAKDAMPAGGHIAIETAAVVLGNDVPRPYEVRAGGYVMLSVTDTGHGMDEATMEHIFEPFFTTKDEGKGTGLGLPSVYGFVKQSGGYIHVYSEPGYGTVFKLYFPRLQDTDAALPYAGGEAGRNGTETLLVVEDDVAVREVVGAILRHFGYQVLATHSGNAAIELVKRSTVPIDLVITDMMMPGVSGPTMVERLIGMYPDLKVLYMSGFADETALNNQAWQGRPIDFLQKPMSAAALTRKVREILDRQASAPLPAAPVRG